MKVVDFSPYGKHAAVPSGVAVLRRSNRLLGW
jgi:hypothetical protein